MDQTEISVEVIDPATIPVANLPSAPRGKERQSISVDMGPKPLPVIMREVRKSTPRSQYHLPENFYRSDILPDIFLSLPQVEQDDYLEAARIPISYDFGYPTFVDGSTLWSKMDHEPGLAYDAFITYVELPQDVLRADAGEIKDGGTGLRDLQHLSSVLKLPPQQLADWYFTYYWGDRARAYDYYLQVARRKTRELRAMRVEDDSYAFATHISSRVQKLLRDLPWDDPEEIAKQVSPKLALEILREMNAMQRVSLGLSRDGGQQKNTDGTPAGASAEVILRTIASQAAPDAAQSANPSGNVPLREILSDPAALTAAQELIIRVGRQGNTSKPPQNGEIPLE